MGKGKGAWMRAMLCACGRRLQASDDRGLCTMVCTHLRQEHSVANSRWEEARKVVAARSYRYEYARVYSDTAAPDEEFGPEPY